MKEEILQKIREMGVPENELENFYMFLSQETIYTIFEDLADKSTDEELTVIENRMKDAKSTQHLTSIIEEIATTAYGENAKEEIKNIYLDLLDSFKAHVEETKALIERANSGDPDAKALLEKAKESDLYQSLMQQE